MAGVTLSFGNSVAFELFHPDVQKQTGPVVHYSGLKWNLFLHRESEPGLHEVSLHCEKIGGGPFSTEVEIFCTNAVNQVQTATFDEQNKERVVGRVRNFDRVAGLMCIVGILEIVEIAPETQKFDFSTANSDLFTDVILEVEGKEFHVCKTTLATFSTYFKNLFFREYLESTQPRIPILGVKAAHFQKLLELIHQKTDITAQNVAALLEIAVFFDMGDVKKRCEKAVMRMPCADLKPKKRIILADKYALTELMNHTLASLTTTEQVQDAVPNDNDELSASTMKLLLERISSLRKRSRTHLGRLENVENLGIQNPAPLRAQGMPQWHANGVRMGPVINRIPPHPGYFMGNQNGN